MSESDSETPIDGGAAAPASADAAARVGTQVASYRIAELLGEGGMGAVYRAEHVHMKKAVALKVLHPTMAEFEEVAARFEREAIASARIEHPNVAKAMDFGRLDDGSFYLVLEYVPGRTLADLIAEGPVPAPRALAITRQIADGIGAAHEAGVVHRDLKPDNVVLGDETAVKILDFGIAKLEASETQDDAGAKLTKVGTVLGTPEYMAPEQGGGGEVDHRADLYAIGLMLYEMLAGKPPFASEDRVDIITQHLTAPPPPLPDSVPAPIAALVMELLAKNPGDRVQSAAELIARIDVLSAVPEPVAPALDDTFSGGTSARIVERSGPPRALVPAAIGAVALLLIAVLVGAIVLREPPELSELGKRAFSVQVPVVRPAVAAKPETEPVAAKPAPAPKPATKQAPAKKKPTAKKKRNTVGGIYIPPPSEWF